MRDVGVIIGHLEMIERETDWKVSPTAPGWWFWDKGGKGAEGNCLFVDEGMTAYRIASERKDGNMDVLHKTEVDKGRCCLVSAW